MPGLPTKSPFPWLTTNNPCKSETCRAVCMASGDPRMCEVRGFLIPRLEYLWSIST